jgi:hypothetical protein
MTEKKLAHSGVEKDVKSPKKGLPYSQFTPVSQPHPSNYLENNKL